MQFNSDIPDTLRSSEAAGQGSSHRGPQATSTLKQPHLNSARLDYNSQAASPQRETQDGSAVKSRHKFMRQSGIHTEEQDYQNMAIGTERESQQNIQAFPPQTPPSIQNASSVSRQEESKFGYQSTRKQQSKVSEIQLIYDNKTVSPRLLSQSQLKSSSRSNDPAVGEIRLNAYEAYKLKKLSTLKRFSPNRMLNKKMREQEKTNEGQTSQRSVLSYLKDSEFYSKNNRIRKFSPQEAAQSSRQFEILNDQNVQIQNCIKFGLAQMRNSGIREKPQDQALLKLLEQKQYSNIDKGMLYNMLVNKCLFSKPQISYNKQLIFKFFQTFDDYQYSDSKQAYITQDDSLSNVETGGDLQESVPTGETPDYRQQFNYSFATQDSKHNQKLQQQLYNYQLNQFRHFFLNRKTHSALEYCTQAANRLNRCYKKQPHVQILDQSVFDSARNFEAAKQLQGNAGEPFQIVPMHEAAEEDGQVPGAPSMLVQVITRKPQNRYDGNQHRKDIANHLSSMSQKRKFPQLMNIHTNGEPLFREPARGSSYQKPQYLVDSPPEGQQNAFSQRKMKKPKTNLSMNQNYYNTSRDFGNDEMAFRKKIMESKRQEQIKIRQTFEKYEQSLNNLNNDTQQFLSTSQRQKIKKSSQKYGSSQMISSQDHPLMHRGSMNGHGPHHSQSGEFESSQDQVNLRNALSDDPNPGRRLMPDQAGADNPYLYQRNASVQRQNPKAASVTKNALFRTHKNTVQMPMISQHRATSSLQEFENTSSSSPMHQVMSDPASIFDATPLVPSHHYKYGVHSNAGNAGQHTMRVGPLSSSIKTSLNTKTKGQRVHHERRHGGQIHQLYGHQGAARLKDELVKSDLRESGGGFNNSTQTGTNYENYGVHQSTDYNSEVINMHSENYKYHSNKDTMAPGAMPTSGPAAISGPKASTVNGDDPVDSPEPERVAAGGLRSSIQESLNAQNRMSNYQVVPVDQPGAFPRKQRRTIHNEKPTLKKKLAKGERVDMKPTYLSSSTKKQQNQERNALQNMGPSDSWQHSHR